MRGVLILALLVGCKGETGVEPLPDEPEDPLSALIIEAPVPGQWAAEGAVEVMGTYDNVSDIRVGGQAATAQDGRFEGDFTLVHGMNLVEVTGVSPAGTTYATHHGVIAGQVASPDEAVGDAARLRLNESGLDLLLELGAGLIQGEAIGALLVTGEPIYELAGDPSVTITPTAFSMGAVGMDVDPKQGQAELTITLDDLSISADVFGRYGGGFAELAQTLTADRVTLTGKLGVDVVDGGFKTTLTDVDVVLTGFGFDDTNVPEWLRGSLTDLILAEVLEGALRVAITDIVPPIVDEQLNGLDLSFQTELLARLLTGRAEITDANFDPEGLVVTADLDVSIDGLNPVDAPGYLKAPSGEASLSTAGDLGLGLADDVLNLVTFEAWRAGMLTYQLSTEDGSLPGYVLSALGGARTGFVTIRADLPPTIVEIDSGLRAQIGELSIRLDTIDGDNGEYVIMAVGGHIDLDLAVEEGVLSVGFGEKDLRITVRDTDWTGSLVEVTEQMEGLLPLDIALGLLEDLEIPLPSFAGLAVRSATVERDASRYHTNVSVSLEKIED